MPFGLLTASTSLRAQRSQGLEGRGEAAGLGQVGGRGRRGEAERQDAEGERGDDGSGEQGAAGRRAGGACGRTTRSGTANTELPQSFALVTPLTPVRAHKT